jgi:hypothetical protein
LALPAEWPPGWPSALALPALALPVEWPPCWPPALAPPALALPAVALPAEWPPCWPRALALPVEWPPSRPSALVLPAVALPAVALPAASLLTGRWVAVRRHRMKRRTDLREWSLHRNLSRTFGSPPLCVSKGLAGRSLACNCD